MKINGGMLTIAIARWPFLFKPTSIDYHLPIRSDRLLDRTIKGKISYVIEYVGMKVNKPTLSNTHHPLSIQV